MRKILLIALNDLRLTARDRSSFIWMLVLPLALMWIFGSMGGGDGIPRVSLTVVDHDGGWLARAFVAELEGDEQIEVVEMTPDEADTAEQKVRTLRIPEGFTEGALAGEQQMLRLEKEPDTSADFALAAEVRTIRVAVKTIGLLVEMSPREDSVPFLSKLLSEVASEPGDPAGGLSGAEAEERFLELAAREALVALEVSTAGEGRPVPTGKAQSVPGMLTMSVVMMTMIYGAVFLTQEKQDGTLRRQMTLPVGRGHVFAGKLGGRFVLAAAQTVVLLLAGRLLYGLSYGNSVAGLLLLATCLCIAVAGLATMLGALLATPDQAGAISWLLGMVLAAIGGCWWPSEVMPRWLWQVAHALPTAWAMDGFHALISFGRGLESVVVPSLVLVAFGIVFSAIGARFLRTAGGGV